MRRVGPTEGKRIVEAGYDVIAQRYLDWSPGRPSKPRLYWLARALELIPAGSDVLELGCGAGVPMTQSLAVGRRVTGVDISTTQIELARRNVPAATFIRSDMTEIDFPAESFDGVVAFYAITHVPRTLQPALFERIRIWLRPGAVLVATLGARDVDDEVEDDWLGVPMFFSHYGTRRNRGILRRAGLEVDEAVVWEEPEHRQAVPFLWVIAHAPAT